MRYNINLNGFQKSDFLKGEELIKRGYTVRLAWDKTLADGKRELKVKIIDRVNYVEKVTVLLPCDGQEILSLECTCGECSGKRLCAHGAVALLTLNEIEVADLQTPTPVPVEETEELDIPQEPSEEPDIPQEPSQEPENPFSIPLATIIDVPTADETVEDPMTVLRRMFDSQPEPEMKPEPASVEPSEPERYEWDGQSREMEILLGHDMDSQEPIYWTPNNTEKIFHTNTGVIGTMGTGKTQFTKSLVTQLYREQAAHKNFDGSPVNLLIFDYKGDYNANKKDFVDAVKASVYKPYRLRYNPLALIQGEAFRPLLPVHTANTFKDTLSKSFGLGAKQQHLLLDCILEAYEKQGILPHDPSTWNRSAPTFAQVYEIFLNHVEGKPQDSLFAAMYKLQTFCIFEPDPSQTVSLTELVQGVTVLDLSCYDPDIQKFVIAITLDQFYAQMLPIGSSKTDGKLRQLRTLILVDEADNFMREDFPVLRKIMKEGREFGVGVILSTQSLKHFAAGEDDYSRYILTWVVHNVSDLTKREIEYIFKLQEKSQEISGIYGQIKDLEKHESIVKISGSEILKMRDRAFYQLLKEE